MHQDNSKTFNVIALGQTTMALFGEQLGSSLQNMLTFKKYVGGTSAVVAIGCARLGLTSALISKVGRDDFGQAVYSSLKKENVATDNLFIHPHLKTAVSFGASQNKQVFHQQAYAENTAYQTFNEGNIQSEFIASTQVLCVSSEELYHPEHQRALRKAMIAANQNHVKVVMILKGQQALTSEMGLESLLPFCNLVVISEQDLKHLFPEKSRHECLTHIRHSTHAPLILKTNAGCYNFTSTIPNDWHTLFHANLMALDHYFEVEAIEAFTAGLIHTWLKQESLEDSCHVGVACAQIVQMRQNHSDALPTIDELNLFMSQHGQIVLQTVNTGHFAHLHYVATRTKTPTKPYIFSFGYHDQWVKSAQAHQANETDIQHAKQCVAQGIAQVSQRYPNVSIICDEQAEQSLFGLFSENNWIWRTVEVPFETPLKTISDDISQTLLSWPKHFGAKVTITYHPDDKYALRGQQEAALSLIYKACRATSHELMVDIQTQTNSLLTPSTHAHIIRRFYEIGIYPDWWQMATPRDARSWDGIDKIIKECDKFCKGVVLSTQTAQAHQFKAIFDTHAVQPQSHGFTVSKLILNPFIDEWFANQISDQELIELTVAAFEKVIQTYEVSAETVKANV